MDHGLGAGGQGLVVSGEAPAQRDPTNTSFDNPAPFNNVEAANSWVSLDDFDVDSEAGAGFHNREGRFRRDLSEVEFSLSNGSEPTSTSTRATLEGPVREAPRTRPSNAVHEPGRLIVDRASACAVPVATVSGWVPYRMSCPTHPVTATTKPSSPIQTCHFSGPVQRLRAFSWGSANSSPFWWCKRSPWAGDARQPRGPSGVGPSLRPGGAERVRRMPRVTGGRASELHD